KLTASGGFPATVTCSSVDATNGCHYTRTLTYAAVDLCNNTNTCSQVISWTVDITPPTFTLCPASTNLGCNPATIPGCDLSPGNVAATDDCSVPVITCSTNDLLNGCLHTRKLSYT